MLEVQGTDTDVEDDVNAGTWASAPTQAINDNNNNDSSNLNIDDNDIDIGHC